MSRPDTFDLDALAEKLARRVAELVSVPARPPALLDVAGKAQQLSVSTDYVREHAAALGGIQLPTNGDRTIWRFPIDTPAARRLDSQPADDPPAATRPRRGPRRARRELLPIRGRAA